MTATCFSVGSSTLTRVPYAEVLVDPPTVSLTAAQVAKISWAAPVWTLDTQVRVAAAVWVIESAGRRIVVDPAQAADGILREGPDAEVHQQAVSELLSAAGFPRESIDVVIASHLDGIGMIAWVSNGGWSPFFPNAQVLISSREYAAITESSDDKAPGSAALVVLHGQGAVTEVNDVHVVTNEVTIRWTGGHSPGHQIVEVSSRGEHVVMLGHLALSPLHFAIDECTGHVDNVTAATKLRELRDSRRTMIGPLWPAPGAARWTGTEMAPFPPVA